MHPQSPSAPLKRLAFLEEQLQKQDVIKVEEPFESGGLGTLFSFPAMEEEMRQREAEERDRERRERERRERKEREVVNRQFSVIFVLRRRLWTSAKRVATRGRAWVVSRS